MNGQSIEIFILQIFIIFFLAKVIGTVLERLKQPAVIGEIFVGILLGNLIIGHINIHEILQLDPQEGGQSIYALAKIGVILLLFLIGLETKFSDLKKVGRTSILVAILGVVFPFIFGFTIILSLQFGNFQAALFVGASMVATSVGITARLLQDMRKLHSREGRIIIGAAVIDDVLGIIVLGIVGGTVEGHIDIFHLTIIIIEACAFIAIFMLFGEKIVVWAIGVTLKNDKVKVMKKEDRLLKLKRYHGPLSIALIVCFGLAALASSFGLAAIIGAFLAGMAFADLKEHYHLAEQIRPIEFFLVPFFFVTIGLQIDLSVITSFHIVLLIFIVTVLAILGKIIGCGFGAKSEGKKSALIIGFGMVPRAEVGIIIAMVGKEIGVLNGELFAALVFMSIITTLITPPILKKLYS